MKLLKKWVGADPESKLNLKLLYKATRDGDTSKAFWDRCNGKPNTFMFAKSKEHNKHFGGYREI